MTQQNQSSFCEMVAQGRDENLRPEAVKKANVFVSHAWQNSFVDVVRTLTKYLEHERDSAYIWFDILSYNQHIQTEMSFEAWRAAIKPVIQDCNRTIMILTPWDDPIPLKRSWCLFELFVTIQLGAKFEVALPPDEHDRLLVELSDRYDVFENMLARVDVQHSKASIETDQERILEDVRETVGFAKLNGLVFDEMRKWVISVAKLDYTKTLKEFGDDHPSTIAAINRLAILSFNQGKLTDAEKYCTMCLNARRKTLGERDPDTLACVNNLAEVHRAQGQYDRAEALYAESLELMYQVLGGTHPDTLNTLNNVATLYANQNKLSEAAALYQLCFEQRSLVLGENDPSTLVPMSNLADLYRRQGNYQEAQELADRCLNKMTIVLGDNHPSTLSCMNNLGLLHDIQDHVEEAKSLYERCLAKKQEVLGSKHPSTLMSANNLAGFYLNQRWYGKAEFWYLRCLGTMNEVLGANHPATVDAWDNLQELYKLKEEELIEDNSNNENATASTTTASDAELLQAILAYGATDEVKGVLMLCVEKRTEVFGPDHPFTYAAHNMLLASESIIRDSSVPKTQSQKS
eukprot:c19690_g2_i1.p1 GENE.c19690_g2_i1~~c19690_g2_i1.p1  ORF type:complete len:649 (+),score=143.81 c19690_g2_i1:224-1948(+)